MEESGKRTKEHTENIVYTYTKDIEALRNLWDEAFDDPEEYAEYYFGNICQKNKILSAYVNDKLVGMIHLNPYSVNFQGTEKKSYYIVGVAVSMEMREKGIMKSMMNKALSDLDEEGVEFVFLMPALEDYYNNLGFKKIYNSKTMDFTILEPEDFEREVSDCYASLMLCTEHMSQLTVEDKECIAEIINDKLGENYQVYCVRDIEYIDEMLKEHRCQSGDVCIVSEHMMSDNEETVEDRDMVGLFSYGLEDDTMYVERFEPFEDNSMALMISVLKLATELTCNRCIITLAQKDVDGYEHILEGIELDVSEGKGIMARILCHKEEEYINAMVGNTFIDEIV